MVSLQINQDSKRKSSSLAEKTKKNPRKNWVQLVQQSIAKNLEYLSPSTDASKYNEFDHPAQHFEHL